MEIIRNKVSSIYDMLSKNTRLIKLSSFVGKQFGPFFFLASKF